MKQHKVTKKSLNNLKPFSKVYQPSNEAKSKGQINLSINKNIIATLRTEIQENTTLLKDIPQKLQEEVKNGKLDNAIKLINMIKESEKQEIDFNSNWGVKKIYVTQEELDAVNKHIDDVINGN